MYESAVSISQRAQRLRDRLTINQARERMSDLGPVPIDHRLGVAGYGMRISAYGPTENHARSLEIANEEFLEPLISTLPKSGFPPFIDIFSIILR